MAKGEIFTLGGVSKKGKQRVKDHGKEWIVIEKRPGTFGGVLLESKTTQDRRWLTDDFLVEKIATAP